MEISGRTFLVTGGGSGLGLATARMLTGAGANVVAADLRGEPDANIRFVGTDVTDEESVGAAVEAALESGPLSGAVNCAGVAIAGRPSAGTAPPSRLVHESYPSKPHRHVQRYTARGGGDAR